MTRGRALISAAALLTIAASLALLLYLYWADVLLVGLGYLCFRFLMHRAGFKRRPKSSWSSLGRTAALMYASWNSRWLRPSSPIKASIPAKIGLIDHPNQFGDLPEGREGDRLPDPLEFAVWR